MDYQPLDIGTRLIVEQPDEFARLVLNVCCYDAELWSKLGSTIGQDGHSAVLQNEFNNPTHFALFYCLLEMRKLCSTYNVDIPFDNIHPDSLNLWMLDLLANERFNKLFPFGEQHIQEVKAEFIHISGIDRNYARAIVEPLWLQWLQNRKSARQIRHINMMPEHLQEKAITRFLDERDRLNAIGSSEDSSAEFGDGLESEDVLVERIPLGFNFTKLDKCLGGGFGKKEHVIFVAPTGSGKTVLACQLAATMALAGKQVILISTEQHSSELEPRILSAFAREPIPFATIKDGGKIRSLLNDRQWAEVQKLREALRGKLHFENWLGVGCTVKEHLEATIKKVIKKHGPQDAIILDWIGGALGAGVDKDAVRHQYMEAATTMKNIAYAYNIAAISFAQATREAINVPKVTEKYIAENKLLHREAVAAFGISAMRTGDSTEDSAAYTEEQYIYCMKTRKSAGLHYKIKRDFSFQRFKDM